MSKLVPAYEGNENYLFVSYAHLNSETVLPVIESLFQEKYRVWYDEGIAPGSEWPKNIEDHLKKANTVLVFVSPESLASPNCENEVANAGVGTRSVISYQLSDTSHPLLKECKTVKTTQELISLLDESLLGDGIHGYERGVGKSKAKNWWNSLIVVASALLVALGIGIYGLNDGWFDSYLPGLDTSEQVVETVPEKDIVEVSGVIGSAIASAANRDDLQQEILLQSNRSHFILSKCLDFVPEERPFILLDITQNTRTELWCEDMNDEVLAYLKYFPELEEINIQNGDFTSLDALIDCPKLKKVRLTYEAFPAVLPENAPFTIEYFE